MLDIIFLICFLSIGSAGLASWVAVIWRKKRGQDLLGRLGERNLIGSPYGLIDVFLVFFAWLGGQVIAVGVAMLIMGISQADLDTLSGEKEAKLLGIVGLAQLVGIMVSLAVLHARYGRGRIQAIGLQPGNVAKDIALGFMTFVMVIPIVLSIQWLLALIYEYDHPSLEMLNKEAHPFTFVIVWFAAGLVAPVCEEVFFRGTLQAWLQRLGPERMKSDQILVGGWDEDGPTAKSVAKPAPVSSQGSEASANQSGSNPYQAPQSSSYPASEYQGSEATADLQPSSWTTQSHWPIYATAAIFAGLHIGQGAAPIPLFVLAVVLGYLYRKTESILPCIVLHMLLNTFSLFWYTLSVLYG